MYFNALRVNERRHNLISSLDSELRQRKPPLTRAANWQTPIPRSNLNLIMFNGTGNATFLHPVTNFWEKLWQSLQK